MWKPPATPSARTTVTSAIDTSSESLSLLAVGDGVLVTTALPSVGRLVLGRAAECDVRIDDGSISRSHAVLQLREPMHIMDTGSANGTWVRNQRLAPNTPVEISVNEAVRLGSVTVIVQRRSTPIRARRLRTHDYFEERVADECAHARTFTLVHVVLGSAVEVHDTIFACLRDTDVVAAYAPGELELLLVDADPSEGRRIVEQVQHALANLGVDAQLGSVWYPRDGRDPSTLVARARSRALGEVVTAAAHGDIVVVDERMNALHALVARVAAADISVLLHGETGVGKEVFADLIHRTSARADKPFVRLNCAALTETLLESELFGHEKGAFTGAAQAKPGLLEVADGGVLFLDEIGELPLSTQAKLLRVLDERKLLRVGAVTPRAIDIRLVSATHRDLEAEVRAGTFRLDLLYRLNTLSIVIPPLRERVAEIEPLAHQFLHEMATKTGRPPPRLSPEAIALLRAYPWPGNVRELRNVIQRAMVLSTGGVIGLGDLSVDKLRTLTGGAPRAAGAPAVVAPELDNDERQRILDALETCNGNQTHAARLLGIARRTLINKLEKFALPRPRKH